MQISVLCWGNKPLPRFKPPFWTFFKLPDIRSRCISEINSLLASVHSPSLTLPVSLSQFHSGLTVWVLVSENPPLPTTLNHCLFLHIKSFSWKLLARYLFLKKEQCLATIRCTFLHLGVFFFAVGTQRLLMERRLASRRKWWGTLFFYSLK